MPTQQLQLTGQYLQENYRHEVSTLQCEGLKGIIRGDR
jgi:hypothetical protein